MAANKLIHSLKFQITAVLFLLLSLFSFAISYTLYSIDEREKENAALQLVSRMQLISNSLEMQSYNYLKNAPRSQSAYQRDIDLFYQDLKGQLDTKNDIINCFTEENLRADLVNMDKDINLNLDDKTKTILIDLQEKWQIYYSELKYTLGDSEESPKLAAAAQYIIENQKSIKKVEDVVITQLQQDLIEQINWVNQVNKIVLGTAFFIALATLAGFYVKVIRPLNKAVEGFNKVARGDFGHQVVINTKNEIASITHSFNHLSQRLFSIFRLIHKVQQGNDLDKTLEFIAEEFASILPINWTSVLLHNGNATMVELQKAFMDGQVHHVPRTWFTVQGTLLEKAINNNKPLLIANLQEVAKNNKHYVFLQMLAKEGMKSAIFLHLTQATQVPGILVFASRQENAYTEEHIELLNNIAHLVTHSLGKTVKMAEQKRLAAIGEFSSGIVHEVRNPLTTIGLALKYFSRLQLDEDGKEWADISNREADRMGRMLEDILLYAKPIKLELACIELQTFITDFIHRIKAMEAEKALQFELPLIQTIHPVNQSALIVKADSDRLNQILLNIYRNAVDAAYEKTRISCHLQLNTEAHTVSIIINNQGDVIPEAVLARIGEPFFTTKSRGTGLGMGIVKRMIEAHGGHLRIQSSDAEGTDIIITLPAMADS